MARPIYPLHRGRFVGPSVLGPGESRGGVYDEGVSNLSRIDQPSKLNRYFSTTKVARYVSSSAIAGALTWIFTANSGLGFLVPGGLGPWVPAAAASALIGFALAPFVVLDPKSCADRVVRSALAMGIGHLALAFVWGVLFPSNLFMGLFWAIGHAAVGAAAGALAGLISWFWGDNESRGRR